MDTKDIIGNEGVSIINNPFLPECIDAIHLHAVKMFRGKMIFCASVEFVNGKTKGEQKFDGKNLADVYNQVATFCTNLK